MMGEGRLLVVGALACVWVAANLHKLRLHRLELVFHNLE